MIYESTVILSSSVILSEAKNLKNYGGVLQMKDSKQILLSYIDCTFEKSIYYELAISLLKHERELPHSSIDKIAQMCFVSPATLSRFCRKLGFENYNEFKNNFNQHYSINHYTNDFLQSAKKNLNTTAENYIDNIHSLMTVQLNGIDPKKVDLILNDIHQSQTILFLGHQLLQSFGSHIQQNLLRFHKLSYSFFQEAHQMEFIAKMDSNALVIILSVDGNYHLKHPKVMKLLMQKKAKTIVITQNPLTPILNHCEHSLILQGNNENEIGKYGMLFLIDYLLFRYHLLYPDIEL
jgi:Transcriptional regulators